METYRCNKLGWRKLGRKGFLLSRGKEEGGGHVDISLHLEPTMDISDKTGAKVDTLFLPPTFYAHNTKHKEVVAYSTNNGRGPTQRKYNETHLEF